MSNLCYGVFMKKAMLHGRVLKDYYVDNDGYIWKLKDNYYRSVSTCIGGGNRYPRVSLYEAYSDGAIKTSTYAHKIVCETFHSFPIPEGVTKKEWDNTPESVKIRLNELYQVNHIDHDPENYHPSNLEWVTVKQNHRKYQEHSRRK